MNPTTDSQNIASPQKNSGFKSFISRYSPPILISLILLAGQLSYGMLSSYKTVLVSVTTCMITESLLARLLQGRWRNLSSAYISGISVSILIRSTLLWPYAVTGMLSIISKYVLQYKGKHIWNPSNFGVSWMLFTAPLTVAVLSIQWGNNMLPIIIIWLLGLVIVYRAKRYNITITYVISFVFFALLRSYLTGDSFLAEVAPITGPMYQLFIFFMITDPVTTVKSKKGQVLVAFLIAFVEFILRMNQFIYAPFYSLFIVGPIAMIIEQNLAKVKKLIPAKG